jgi:hypothetical protein
MADFPSGKSESENGLGCLPAKFFCHFDEQHFENQSTSVLFGVGSFECQVSFQQPVQHHARAVAAELANA